MGLLFLSLTFLLLNSINNLKMNIIISHQAIKILTMQDQVLKYVLYNHISFLLDPFDRCTFADTT